MPVPVLLSDPSVQALLGSPAQLAGFVGRRGVVTTGHYRLLGGDHSAQFVRFSQLAHDEQALTTVSSWLATVLAPWQPTAVLAPVTAGVALGSALARDLGCALALASVDESGRADAVLDAYADLHRTVLVNDVITTGHGLNALDEVARAAGAGETVAAAFLSRRSDPPGGAYEGPLALVGLANLPAWPEHDCELCRKGIELEDGLDLN